MVGQAGARSNIWVLAGAFGYVFQFEPDQSVKKGKQVASSTKWGLGDDMLTLNS